MRQMFANRLALATGIIVVVLVFVFAWVQSV